jgi:DNA invertase Pin-like site-specific DNA recombinase
MLDQIRPSETIIVWKRDRLARSTPDLFNTMEAIGEAGGKFQSRTLGQHYHTRRQDDYDRIRRDCRV